MNGLCTTTPFLHAKDMALETMIQRNQKDARRRHGSEALQALEDALKRLQ